VCNVVECHRDSPTRPSLLAPPQNKGDKKAEEKFQEAQNAYETLSDKDKRSAYDMYGHDAEQMGGMGGPGGGGGFQRQVGMCICVCVYVYVCVCMC
jgi:hypothetical protein